MPAILDHELLLQAILREGEGGIKKEAYLQEIPGHIGGVQPRQHQLAQPGLRQKLPKLHDHGQLVDCDSHDRHLAVRCRIPEVTGHGVEKGVQHQRGVPQVLRHGSLQGNCLGRPTA